MHGRPEISGRHRELLAAKGQPGAQDARLFPGCYAGCSNLSMRRVASRGASGGAKCPDRSFPCVFRAAAARPVRPALAGPL